jgi:hypothetical protein
MILKRSWIGSLVMWFVNNRGNRRFGMSRIRFCRSRTSALPLFVAALLASLSTAPLVRAEGTPTIGPEIGYASGGIGKSERDEMQAMLGKYSLKLMFAIEGSGAYVSGVSVTLSQAGEPVFKVTDVGPWLLVKLPAGAYRVTAESVGKTAEASVTVPEAGHVEAVLRFPPE